MIEDINTIIFQNNNYSSQLIDSLLSIDITHISCGPEHTIAVGDGGQVYAWGCGDAGRLGTGNTDDQ